MFNFLGVGQRDKGLTVNIQVLAIEPSPAQFCRRTTQIRMDGHLYQFDGSTNNNLYLLLKFFSFFSRFLSVLPSTIARTFSTTAD